MKKRYCFKIRKSIYRAMGSFMIMLLVILTSSVTSEKVSASEESKNQTITYVYHRHIGNSQSGGICYKTPVKHIHSGSEATYGGCYQTPVYHVHQGSASSGGGCYGKCVYHVHTGSENTGGGCYTTAVIHEAHVEACTRLVSSSELGCYVLSTEETDEYDENGNRMYYFYMSCNYVVNKATPEHYHKVEQCVGIGNVERYALGCGKSSSTVERYELNCGKNSSTVESYAVSCSKTTETIEGYSLSCGKDEATPYGKIILTEEKTLDPEKVRITVTFEDLTGGELQSSSDPFTWYDNQGNMIGKGDSIEVSENGDYRVKVDLINDDVDKDRLTGSITIDSIVKVVPTLAPTETPTTTPTLTPTTTPTLTPTTTPTLEPTVTPTLEPTVTPTLTPTETPTGKPTVTPTWKPTPTVRPTATPTVTPTAKPTATPAVKPTVTPTAKPTATPTGTPAKTPVKDDSGDHDGEGGEDEGDILPIISPSPTKTPAVNIDDSAGNDGQDGEEGTKREKITATANPLPVKEKAAEEEKPDLRRQIQKLELPQPQGENQSKAEIKDMQQKENPVKAFFSSPVVQLVTMTAGTLIALLLLLLLLYLLRTTVRLYNDDKEGRLIYLGRCRVQLKEEGYTMEITDELVEKAVTNRYCIKPGMFRWFKSKEEEIIVCRQEKRIAVPLSKEMYVVI
ncbi:MAG: PT domain-containing protein [Suilimivivens sp.]